MEELMNRFAPKLVLIFCALTVTSTVFAGSVDYLCNKSAKYMMTYTRNGSVEISADIAAFNPAGTAMLPKGLYFDISNQSLVLMPYSQDSEIDYAMAFTDKDQTFEQNNPNCLLPNAYAVYSFGDNGAGNLALFLQAGIVAGGGTLKWNDGTAGTTLALSGIGANSGQGDITSQSFEAMSVYYGLGLGCANSFMDNMLSVSLGGRYVRATRSFSLDAAFQLGGKLDCEYSYVANGFTPIVGIDFKPTRELNIALRFDYQTYLRFIYNEERFDASTAAIGTATTNVLTNAGIADGSKITYDLPLIIGLGSEYALTPRLTLMASGNLYLLSLADLGSVKDPSGKRVDLNDYFGTGWEVSAGFSYMLMKNLKIGAGVLYTEIGVRDSYYESQNNLLNASANLPLDSIAVGLGGTWFFESLGIDLTLAASWIHYLPHDYEITPQGATAALVSGISGTYSKDICNITLGLGCKL
jgi:long-subunit fatty acid transport protein